MQGSTSTVVPSKGVPSVTLYSVTCTGITCMVLPYRVLMGWVGPTDLQTENPS